MSLTLNSSFNNGIWINMKAIRLTAIRVNDYKCPKCKEYPIDDNPDGYIINGIKYPQYFNERKGSTMDGLYHDWNELHKCERCNIEYWYRNGAY